MADAVGENAAGHVVAVIGAGPAGLFAARALAAQRARVLLLNRDIKPGGLAEYGIFLNKYKMKSGLRRQFQKILTDPRVIKFPTPGGTSTGTSDAGPCTVYYTGVYNCKGDPTVPAELQAPTIKFNTDDGPCVTATTGTGTWVFYSPFAPGPYSVDPEGAAIKHGQGICVGTLSGTMPMGDCATPATAKSWGGVKAMYR